MKLQRWNWNETGMKLKLCKILRGRQKSKKQKRTERTAVAKRKQKLAYVAFVSKSERLKADYFANCQGVMH